ncbi:MAG: hypothetical protein ABI920_07700 [Casimicrobiaceae bacterium]
MRRGALTFTAGGIIGGNTFDVLLLAAADVAYRQGSIYHAFTGVQLRLIAVSLLMNGVLAWDSSIARSADSAGSDAKA